MSPEWGRILWDTCFFFPLIFVLRLALTFLSLLKYTYKRSSDIGDVIWWAQSSLPYETFHCVLWLLGSVMLWWTRSVLIPVTRDMTSIVCFVESLCKDPDGRTLYQIFSDPRCSNDSYHGLKAQPKMKKRSLVRTVQRTGRRPMLTSRRSQLILSHNIIVDGANCNRSNMANHKVQASLHSDPVVTALFLSVTVSHL